MSIEDIPDNLGSHPFSVIFFSERENITSYWGGCLELWWVQEWQTGFDSYQYQQLKI